MKTHTFTTKTTLFCKLLLLLFATLLLVSCSQPDQKPGDTVVKPIDEKRLMKLIQDDHEDRLPGILCYYGTYNGCVVVRYDEPLDAIRTVEVAGVTFVIPTFSYITVWKDGKSYYLQAAYDEGLLNKEQLQTISDIQNKGTYIIY